MKSNDNVYFCARKDAALYNEKLFSRESAAELLGISASTLADYELGVTKVVPVDKVVLMADLYNHPELKSMYCMNECPIRGVMPLATEEKNLQGITLRILKSLKTDDLEILKDHLIDITEDGFISNEEVDTLKGIMEQFEKLTETISELKIVSEKCLKNRP